MDQPSCTIPLQAEAQEFIQARSVQSDIGPDMENGRSADECEWRHCMNMVAMDGLREHQDVDTKLHIIQSWLQNSATVPGGNEQ